MASIYQERLIDIYKTKIDEGLNLFCLAVHYEFKKPFTSKDKDIETINKLQEIINYYNNLGYNNKEYQELLEEIKNEKIKVDRAYFENGRIVISETHYLNNKND